MNRKLWALLFAAMLVLTGAMTIPSSARPVPPPPDYFPLKPGYWWKYKATNLDTKVTSEWIMKVLKTEKSGNDLLYQVEVTAGQTKFYEWYSKPRGWVYKHKIEYVANEMKGTYDPIDKYLMNPPTTGATWNWSGKGMMDVESKHDDRVKGGETVVVPAGKFACQRVDTEQVQGGQNVHKTYWYANWIGLVKSTTDSGGVRNQSELVDYSFKTRR